MHTEIIGSPSFAYINVNLETGESIIAESGAMASMAADLDMEACTNGGFFPALMKKVFGGESFFINEFTNYTADTKRLVLTQNVPGDIREIHLRDESFCLQPGAYIASTPGLKLGVKWAGLVSWIAQEGLFRLEVSGTGKLWYGAFGGLVEKEIDGEYIVDTSHLVAYQPHLKLRLQLASGVFSSLFGGEGIVTRIEGKGRIILQTRSIPGIRDWLNARI